MNQIKISPDMTDEQFLEQVRKLKAIAKKRLTEIDAEIARIEKEIDDYDRMLERSKNVSVIMICGGLAILILLVIFLLFSGG